MPPTMSLAGHHPRNGARLFARRSCTLLTPHCRITLKSFSATSNAATVAAEIVAKCKYIHPSKVAFVEDLLRQLQTRLASAQTAADVDPPEGKLSDGDDVDEDSDDSDDGEAPVHKRKDVHEPKPAPAAAKRAPTTAREQTPKPLAATAPPEPAAPAPEPAAPVKRKGKKRNSGPKASTEDLDAYLELLYEEAPEEITRGAAMILQLVQQRDNVEAIAGNPTTIGALARVLNENRKKNTDLVTTVLDVFRCLSNYSALHYILLDSKIGDTTMRIVDLECKRYEMAADGVAAKRTFLARQERLLFVAFYILMNMAEDLQIEVKMVNRDIVRYLLGALGRVGSAEPRSVTQLQVLVLTFLKKLSVLKENVAAMADLDAVRTVGVVFNGAPSAPVTLAALRLLFNLTFHSDLRRAIAAHNAIIASAIQVSGDHRMEQGPTGNGRPPKDRPGAASRAHPTVRDSVGPSLGAGCFE